MPTRNEYFRQILEWERTYGKDAPKYKQFNFRRPSECSKCGVRKHLHRHHKANDFTFALLWPEVYAKRYIEFHPEDIDYLCENCHKNYHKSGALANLLVSFRLVCRIKPLNSKEREIWKTKFLKNYERWLKLKRKKKKSSKR